MEFPAPMRREWFRTGIPVALGAIAGFAYYHYIGCASGACPLTGNPWTSTAYGAVMGFLISPRRPASREGASSSGRETP